MKQMAQRTMLLILLGGFLKIDVLHRATDFSTKTVNMM